MDGLNDRGNVIVLGATKDQIVLIQRLEDQVDLIESLRYQYQMKMRD